VIARRQALAGLVGAGGALALAPSPAFAGSRLYELALRLAAIYRASDADSLHRMLAPGLESSFPPAVLSRWLAEARAAFGMLQRTSMPTYGNRTHGVFAAYFDRGPADMYLEIDSRERLVLWAFKNDAGVLALRGRT
jgi:hypothetical protein